MAETATDTFAQWVVLELMRHRRLAGYLTEAEIGGGSLLRLDIPDDEDPDGWKATQYYSPGAVYAITPTEESTARLCAKERTEPPVSRWELQRMLPEPQELEDDDMGEDAER